MKITKYALVAGVALTSFGITAAGGQIFAPPRAPDRAADVPPLPPPEQLVIHGTGAQAASALNQARTALPFVPVLPTSIPYGYVLSRVEARVISATTAVLDVVYAADNESGLHVFQSASAPNKPEIARVEASATMQTTAGPWRYALLVYPQPDGTKFRVHFMDRSSPGGYMSISLRSTGDDGGDTDALRRAADSLR